MLPRSCISLSGSHSALFKRIEDPGAALIHLEMRRRTGFDILARGFHARSSLIDRPFGSA